MLAHKYAVQYSRMYCNKTITCKYIKFNNARPEKVWLVTSRLGTDKSLTFFYSVTSVYVANTRNAWCNDGIIIFSCIMYLCTSYLHVYRCVHTVFINNPCNAYLYTCILHTYISINLHTCLGFKEKYKDRIFLIAKPQGFSVLTI